MLLAVKFVPSKATVIFLPSAALRDMPLVVERLSVAVTPVVPELRLMAVTTAARLVA